MPDFDKERLQNVSSLAPIPATQNAPSGAERAAALRDLDKVFIRGVAWTAAVKWLTQVFIWGTTVVVARLLLPSDYGLVGMAAIYINLFTLFSEFGIGTAVVTLQDLSDEQISQLNALSFLLGVLGFCISVAAAIPLGWFFRAPNLPLVVVVLSAGFIVSGIRTVPYALLQKELRFKLLAVIEGAQGVVQALVTLLLAFLGFRYWALVLGIVSFSITPTVLVFLWRRHSFSFPRIASIRRAIHYSRHILIGRLAWAAYNDSDFIVAGRVLGQAPLGAYTLAWTLAHTPLDKLTTLVNRITPSVFAKIQTDSGALRRYLKNITGVMALLIFPATIGLALVAPEFVPLVLGPKWIAAIIPLQLLVLHALVRSNVILLGPILNVVGAERLAMWISLIAMFVLPLSFYIGSRWGTVGIAAGWVAIYPLLQIPLFSRIFRRIDLPRSDYLATMWPALNGCALMALSIAAFRLLSTSALPLYLRFTLEVLIGAAAYGVVLFFLHRDYVKAIVNFLRTSRVGPA